MPRVKKQQRQKPLEYRKRGDALIEAEEERYRTIGQRRIFYHPELGTNCIAQGSGFVLEVGPGEGNEFDVARWSGDGECPVRPVSAKQEVSPPAETPVVTEIAAEAPEVIASDVAVTETAAEGPKVTRRYGRAKSG